MPELSYKSLDTQTKAVADKLRSFGVILIWGEEALCDQALKKIAAALLPGGRRNPAFETLDGAEVNMPLAVERVNTYSLLSGKRVVLLADSGVFYARQDHKTLLEKAAVAHADGRSKHAADWLLKLLAGGNLGLDDVSVTTLNRLPGIVDVDKKNLAWVLDVVDYCRRQAMEVPAAEDAAGLLKRALESGFPPGNFLIITSGKIRKTTSLYRTVKKLGLIVDCSVPGGGRMVDKRVRSELLRKQTHEILAKSGKRIAPDAMAAVEEMTGFDLRAFTHNIEKLISYTGKHDNITRADVDKVLSRSKKDLLYEFTGAVIDRCQEDALFFLNSLLADGTHPLQLLAAMINQVRRLILVKDFASGQADVWRSRMGYDQFQARVLPAVKKHDATLQETMASWRKGASRSNTSGDTPSGKKKTQSADLMLFSQRTSPYGLYMLFKKCERFSMRELVGLMYFFRKSDAQLKTSAQDPKMLLESAVLHICRTPDASPKP